ncbi:sulfonate ABC transporter ATP-binding protein [candidate division KSB3 bacterium]|uniref:Sulfonate ABC transporter ATP-binding protein n=1 Tax=candidate division KSB3 bacterium TaxID=2044937 RepID=A0A2G6E306_9BACT|nr:MAG: sulfonate ABC transporter ATP-binding protein [candidate division KSB3 bacterium]PIE28932.1 MAG: sulfonate ABC transporter ATP-binding protein [candidate division KSB3 bacterium]
MINIQHVSYAFPTQEGPLPVLNDISLSIQEGQFISFIGPSGCGKTTLLHLIAHLIPLQVGSICLCGSAGHEIIEKNLYSIIFQEITLLDWLTVKKNIELPVNLNPQLRYVDSQDIMERLGLSDYQNLYPSQLSGGMKTRVSIARSLMTHTPVLLMDECFASLDEVTREQMNLFLLSMLRKISRTLVLITHSIAEAVFISDRVIVFSQKPSRIIGDIAIELPRPRRLEHIENSDYIAYRKVLREFLNQSSEESV